MKSERQLTHQPKNHVLTNIGVWSPDGRWIVYDTRSGRPGADFDGATIECVDMDTGAVRELYRAQNGAHCGVVTCHPVQPQVVFILGPEHPTPDWQYNFYHRRGVLVGLNHPQATLNLDARDVTPPFTPGALRGGSHVHVFSADGQWVSYTYEDHVLAQFAEEDADHEMNLRNIGVSVFGHPVRVPRTHPRNQDGETFSVLVTRTTAQPRPGSDEIRRAIEEGWIGTNGYVRPDGTRQKRALAFQGEVVRADGQPVLEVYRVDLPEDVTQPGDGPLAGTATRRPRPPRGTVQQRLTFTTGRKFPGIQGPRHWLRSSPDGARIAFLMKDDAGVVQLWTVSPHGGAPVPLTRNPFSIASAFSWSPDGRWIAHVMDNSVCVSEVRTGQTLRLTARFAAAEAPRPEACVFSPDGRHIAYLRPQPTPAGPVNQIFICSLP
ncbi:MAG TPA: DUF3748 domain-containing protein [Verrucomicrobiota bacterium]|nr:DUF3748 domain-containing protein [Verrucomicrobiota bacterium]HNT14873.1 DUF3748 domain-containing protein [Verrucomicrobiota bacterium]